MLVPQRWLSASALGGALLFGPSGCGQEIYCLLFAYAGVTTPNECFVCKPDCEGEGDPGSTLQAVLRRVDMKTMPIGLEADEDTKDVSVRDRRKFKPSKGSDTGLDRRFRMQAKRDDAAACIALERAFLAPANTSVRVAIDDTKGLVDGVSLAFLERRIDAPMEGEPAAVRLEAVWNADINGLTVRGRVDGELVGATADYPDTTEVFLQIVRTGANSYDVDGDSFDSLGALSSILDPLQDPSGPSRFTLGIEGVGKKGAFWFAQWAFEISSSYLGTAEAQLAFEVGKLVGPLKLAEFFLGFPTTDPRTFDGVVNNLDVTASEVFFLHLTGLEKGSYGDETDLGKLHKAVTRLNQRVFSLTKKSAKLAAKGGSILSLSKSVERALDAADVVFGVLHGFESLSPKRLGQSAEVVLL